MKASTICCDLIILSKNSFGDGHIGLAILTENFGLIRATAFGGSRLSKRFKGGLDYFQILDAEIKTKHCPENTYYEISSINKVKHRFSNITKSIQKYTAATYISELCSMLLTPLEKNAHNSETYYKMLADCLNKVDIENNFEEIMNEVYKLNTLLYESTGFTPKIDFANDTNSKLQQIEHFNSQILDKAPKSFELLWNTFYKKT
jgi:DNA repair protein RecO